MESRVYKVKITHKDKRKSKTYHVVGWDMQFPDFIVLEEATDRNIYINKADVIFVDIPRIEVPPQEEESNS